MRDFIMSVIYYNGRFIITAKSLETNVAVVTRVDCTSVITHMDSHHCRRRAVKLRQCSALSLPLSRKGDLNHLYHATSAFNGGLKGGGRGICPPP